MYKQNISKVGVFKEEGLKLIFLRCYDDPANFAFSFIILTPYRAEQ